MMIGNHAQRAEKVKLGSAMGCWICRRLYWQVSTWRRAEKEVVQLLERIKQDTQLLTTLATDFKAKQAELAQTTPSGAQNLAAERLQSEVRHLALSGKQASERHKADKAAYGQIYQRIEALREHEEDLFHGILSQVQRRMVNDCANCQDDTDKVCTFSDDSEQCTECQRAPLRECQGSVDDEDTVRMRDTLRNVESQIDEALSRDRFAGDLYRSLKERLQQEQDAGRGYIERLDSTPQERVDHVVRVSRAQRTRKELENFRKLNLVDDAAYQELRVRRRLLDECHSELLQRGVFYFDEIEELAGHPQRRGDKIAETMDNDEFREAVL